MTSMAPEDLDPIVAGRLQALAQARGWSLEEAISHALERGLLALEAEATSSLAAEEADVLKAAISAMEQIPDGTFAAIGKVPARDGEP